MSVGGVGAGAARAASPMATAARMAALAAGLLAAGFALRGLPASLRAPAGIGAPMLVVLGAASCAAGVPRQAVAFAGGYAFGVWGGGALALLAQSLGCAASFFWARLVGRAWARRRLAGRLARIDAFLAAHPGRATLMLRLLPVGNNLLLNLLAGVSAIPALPFLMASVVGYVPLTVIFALLGSGASVGRWERIAVAAGLFALSIGVGYGLWRRVRREVSA